MSKELYYIDLPGKLILNSQSTHLKIFKPTTERFCCSTEIKIRNKFVKSLMSKQTNKDYYRTLYR